MRNHLTRRDWITSATSALAAAGLSACGPKPTLETPSASPLNDRPNIIVYLADTMRADHLSCYGYPIQTSPGIDWMAGLGVLFEKNTSGSNWTKPALGTMLTGVPARVHRAVVSGPSVENPDPTSYRVEVLRDVFETLPTILKSVGYSTAYFQANPHGRPEFGYGRGFDTARCEGTMSPRRQMETALRWAKHIASEPFFLFIHEIDPHGPYVPTTRSFRRLHGSNPPKFIRNLDPDEAKRVTRYVEMLGAGPEIKQAVQGISMEANRYIQMNYDAEIYQIDSLIEEFVLGLTEMGIMDHTIVALTSDHGEAFGEHGYYAHGSGLPYDELLRVPLIMFGGNLPQGVRVPHNTTMLDFYPTLLELAQAPIPEYVPGKPMFSAERELLVKENRLAYIDIDKRSPNLSNWDAAIITGQYKVASQNNRSAYLIFDRELDPGERKNLVGTGTLSIEEEQNLISALQTEVAKYEALGESFGAPEWTDGDQNLQEELNALGYV